MPRKPKAAAKPATIESRVDVICERISAGESLRSICRDIGIDESTARYYFTRDADAHDRLQRARELGCDALADECIEIADGGGEAADKRVRVDTRLRLMGKWSQRYGDKVQHTGADGGPIRTEGKTTLDMAGLDDEQLRVLASIRVPT